MFIRTAIKTLFFKLIQIWTFLLIFCLTFSSHYNKTVHQQAYIWQKKWLKTLDISIKQSSPYIEAWHFLAGEYEPEGIIRYPNINFKLLKKTSLPLIAVYRFDRLHPLPSSKELLNLIQNSPAFKEFHIHSIELDLDWPSLKLMAYVTLIRELRRQLPNDIRFYFTALPDWLNSASFPQLTEQAEAPILQLHAIENPKEGIFNEKKAQVYINQMNRLSKKPFYIALPTYGLKVNWLPSGNLAFIAGENKTALNYAGHEFYSDPILLSRFVAKLELNTPRKLKGLIWFRLPVSNDQRNWSLKTWKALLTKERLYSSYIILFNKDKNLAHIFTIEILNTGNTPLSLPKKINLTCSIGDGFFPYTITNDNNDNAMLILTNFPYLLNTDTRLQVGWMRC
ncbi:hypothetical protein COMNV_00014 [Commensalibacter sp. Nvir]|uniref:DUF3142 domain-containing protein n=1 Tax=Commensalibacter sp. Nvir TaxID=3069817 RepID=UPI002D397DEF|nr:hypothetical protein COMNV_00014 [Commensalibacter sp. Nvir]